VIIALNDEERAFIADELGLAEKCVVMPNGLASARFSAFDAQSAPPEIRIAKPLVAFIGYWSARKGSHDWGSIIRAVRTQVPGARFVFLGTGRDEAAVLSDLEVDDDAHIRVVPSFDSDELPTLLSEATVGALPSYVEGFPIAVLEELAAGLPTVAYDAPGPPEALREVDARLLTPPGDVDAFAARLASVLCMSVPDYTALAERCRVQASRHSWSTISESTLSLYSERLAELRSR
jgi:glycosyltransferase involved in cell wall biosynthesis